MPPLRKVLLKTLLNSLKSLVITSLTLVVTILAISCTPVADPRQGGLFGYSPQDYERRIKEREDRLHQAEATGAEQQAQREDLQTQVGETKVERDKLKTELSSFDKDLDKLRRQLQAQKSANPITQEKQQQLEGELNALRQNSWRTGKQLDSGNVTDKEREIAQLKKRLADLMEEAEILGRME